MKSQLLHCVYVICFAHCRVGIMTVDGIISPHNCSDGIVFILIKIPPRLASHLRSVRSDLESLEI